ncbi:D-alanine--D-alanine ligase [Kangiella koreensis]|uniref:D-alanine--D-alanine ligase n=1 Tax=Kangiella koreensis (strain DSM 16069 / JCM 12317 / KCTC 12182 / SW-125) TaxID=523791 RepID=C7R9M0_KANKD|nr:D-alanine--D-alanine ligase [Kangiella koreensis]ACV26111.1 D-alanine/D-alanine ligase [Kangiella koreensis DSM 16069]
MSIDKFGKVVVLYGGNSAEKEISLRSGKAVYNALLNVGIDAVLIDPEAEGLAAIQASNCDRVWNALHGRGGEDGVIQAHLQLLGLPYTGSGVMASAIAMDKLRTKLIWQAMSYPVAKHRMLNTGVLTIEQAEDVLADMNDCVMVKPIREGSSVGMAKADNAKALVEAVENAKQYDREVMLEQWIDGEEYTVSILNGKALPSIRVKTPNTFYDFQAKYQSQSTEYVCPSGLNDEDEAELAELSQAAFYALGCEGWGRVDLMRERSTGNWLLLEVNTVPGMTETSLVPKAAKQSGMSFDELVVAVLETSFVERH